MFTAILAAVSIGMADAFSKYAVMRLKTGRLMVISGIVQLSLNAAFFLVMKGTIPAGMTLLKLSAVQVVSTLAYVLYILALLNGNVSVLTAIISSSSIFSVVLGIVILGEKMSLPQATGVILIIAGSIGISFEKKTKAEDKQKKHLWLALTFAATILWGVWAFLSKIMLSQVKVYELSFFNSSLSFLLLTPYFIWAIRKEKDAFVDFKSVSFAFLFALFVGAGLILFYYSATKIPISLASPVFCSSPLITAIMSAFMFRERLHMHQYISLFVIISSLFLL
ncbi:MAG: EamA family transporter [bacterium]|nr:EamA family transporter [bacterium]